MNSSNSNSLIMPSINSISEFSKEFNFELLSEKEKEQKFCRCPICRRIPLIYYYNSSIFLKCIYCPDVYTKRTIGSFNYSDLCSYKKLLSIKNLDKIYISNGNFYDSKIDEHCIPLACIDNYCDEHLYEKYYFFCETCKKNLCNKCNDFHKMHNVKKLEEYQLNNDELEEIQTKINECKSFVNSLNNLYEKIIKILSEDVIKVCLLFESDKINNLSETFVNDLIEKIPKSVNNIFYFPYNFHNYLVDLINLIIDEKKNSLNQNKEISKNISSLEKEIIQRFTLFQENMKKEGIISYFENYQYKNKILIDIAQNILDMYKEKEFNLNYQLCINLQNLKNNLNSMDDKIVFIDELDEFKNIINKINNNLLLINSYEVVKNEFSSNLLNIDLYKIKKKRIISNIDYSASLYKTSIRELKIINWIQNMKVYNELIFIFNRK